MKLSRVKKLYLYFSAVLTFMLHIPVAFANTTIATAKKVVDPIITPVLDNKMVAAVKMYDSLKLNIQGLSEHAFLYAMKGFEYLKSTGKIANDHIISIVDFTRPSSQKRLFVIDIEKYKVLFNTYVAHGQGSGAEMATQFSNTPESFQSSLGFYRTSSTYFGKNGFSMKLCGLENGINSNAENRAIVMHAAPYVSEEIAQNQGHIGRSWGCPAVSEKLNKPIIETIKNGSCLFIFSENKKYIQGSKIINN
jgi:L,D-transpeptidase catalytic domain